MRCAVEEGALWAESFIGSKGGALAIAIVMNWCSWLQSSWKAELVQVLCTVHATLDACGDERSTPSLLLRTLRLDLVTGLNVTCL